MQWFGWDSHYHPLTLMSEFLIGALTAAAARRHSPPAMKGEEKPLLFPPAPSMSKLLTVEGATQWLVDNRLGLVADFCIASTILLTVLVPRPVTYTETCPASSDVGWMGGVTGGYWWDPFAVCMQPLICLLTCGFLYSTMLAKDASQRGVLSWYLAACSGWAPYCLAVYLWQIPFSHYFSAGDKMVDVMVPMMFFALFVFSAMYTELIEKRTVQLVRYGCGKLGELASPSSSPAEVTVTEPLTRA